ncbi:MAG: hypothetical protein GXP31_03630 [Kiritimatiellaeota bacterium]|nr:hypothetical protein [Kiritimatiellota bacterium]
MRAFTIHPRDLLFFRDARPMGGSSEGAGAQWPLPSVLHSALLSAFHDRWPEDEQGWESKHIHHTDREQKKFATGKNTTMRFGGLRTVGPFPWLQTGREKKKDAKALPAGLYLPTPADIVEGGLMQPVKLIGSHNLPPPLQYAVASPLPPSKDKPGAWIAACELRNYLAGNAAAIPTAETGELYDTEARPGVGIDPDTHANRQSVFYQAEYLRLRADVGMAFLAEAKAKKYGEKSGIDLFEKFLAGDTAQPLILGGQRGLAAVRRQPGADDLALASPKGSIRIKWVLLAPALFENGWRPDWVGENGKVLLKQMPDRAAFPTRKAWREAARTCPEIPAVLVAARIPKPVAVSGWKLRVDGGPRPGGPKPTRLLVPAGAVYYFECADEAAGAALVRQLHLKVKSQRLGEQGFGFGVCGTWEFLQV